MSELQSLDDSSFTDVNDSPNISPKLLQDKDKSYSSVLEEVSRLRDEISSLSRENATANANCTKLERNLYAVACALTRDVGLLQSINERLATENTDLKDSVQTRQSILDKIEPLIESVIQKGIIPDDLDSQFVKDFFGSDITSISPGTAPIITLDETAYTIVSSYPEFDGIRTNEDFLKKLSKIQSEIESMRELQASISKSSDVSQLRRELALLKSRQTQRAAHDAMKLRRLDNEKERLEQQIREKRFCDISPVKPSARRMFASPISLH